MHHEFMPFWTDLAWRHDQWQLTNSTYNKLLVLTTWYINATVRTRFPQEND